MELSELVLLTMLCYAMLTKLIEEVLRVANKKAQSSVHSGATASSVCHTQKSAVSCVCVCVCVYVCLCVVCAVV
jgi:p-aminobenzoyl-glutamate transporter AbgT